VCCSRLQLGQLLVRLLSQRGIAKERVHSRAVCGLPLVQLCTPPLIRVASSILKHITELSAGYFEARLCLMLLCAIAMGCW
jgi:hypothetical protein